MPILAAMEPLNDSELEALATTLPAWTIKDKKLQRQFRFKDFSRAWGFMTRVALLAEQQNHHPTWQNSYGRVWISITTHDTGAITALDVRLARAIDALA